MKSPVLIIICALCLARTDAVWAVDRFHVTYQEPAERLDISLCFNGEAPSRLHRHREAAAFSEGPYHRNQRLATRSSGSRLYLPDLPENACISWRFDLKAAAQQDDYRTAFRSGDSILAATTLWFWKGPWERPVEVVVNFPEGVSLSTPWTRDPHNPNRYLPEPTPASWSTRSAIGRFHHDELEVPGGPISLAILGRPDGSQIDKLTRWIRTTVDAIVPVFGYFPRTPVQVVVVPIGSRREAVPWAHVVRGGGASVQFYVDETRPLSEFQDDWTATHEFSHLLLPYVSRNDRWLSEGLASYYQNVLRARDGRLSEQQAWQKLHEGFRRGEKGTKRETLREATEGGWDSTMRVYWSGAAMMLQADTQIRQATDGTQTLDSALQALTECCREPGKLWRAGELLSKLDELTGTTVFGDIYRENVSSLEFPDVANIYEALGLVARQGRIRIEAQAPLRDIRQNIMTGEAGGTRARSGGDNAP